MKRVLTLFLVLVVLVIGIAFAVLNAEPVELHFYFGSLHIPFSLALMLTLIVGAVLGVVASASLFLNHRRENTKLKKTVEIAEKEINNLRSIPIRDKH